MNDWQRPDGLTPLGYDMHEAVRKIADGDSATANGLMWALSRWFAEVANRPLVNVHRRSLDDTWRQVIRYFGGEAAIALIAAPHDELVASMGAASPTTAASPQVPELTFNEFRRANVARCLKWHPQGIASWSPSDWLTAVTGELGELASLLKMRNRERDGLPGNKFSPTDKMVADELADVLTYLDLLAEVLGVDLGTAAVAKFNEVSERVGFPDRIALRASGATEGQPSTGMGEGA